MGESFRTNSTSYTHRLTDFSALRDVVDFFDEPQVYERTILILKPAFTDALVDDVVTLTRESNLTIVAEKTLKFTAEQSAQLDTAT